MKISKPNPLRCARCGRDKPATEYRPNLQMRSGIHSWCLDCEREYAKERPYRPDHISPHTSKISKAFDSGDALNYSRAVCEHIAWYVQRKITEFETTHEKEAPPHMTAILSIANSITAQHPPKVRKTLHGVRVDAYELRCRRCDEAFKARTPTALHCDACRPQARRESKQKWYMTPAGQAYRAIERSRKNERARVERESRPPKPPVIVQCSRCGRPVEAKTRTRKYCDDCRYLVRVEYIHSDQHKEAQRRWRESERGQELLRAGRRAYKQRQREKRAQTA